MFDNYEYKVTMYSLNATPDSLIDFSRAINEWGEEGYRFITSFPINSGHVLLFSRPMRCKHSPDMEKVKKAGNSVL